MKILCIGPIWRGSNAGGLFNAICRLDCMIEIIDEFYYISLRSTNRITKVFEKFIRSRQLKEFNHAIKTHLNIFYPEVLLIYKGSFVLPETILYAKSLSCKVVCFYPDVSMSFHGTNIPLSMPLYDIVFTTKTFGIKDMKEQYGVKNAVFIPHGFDPNIHRTLPVIEENNPFICDVSFIGTWSPKKERILSFLKQKLPNIDLKIWGSQWNKASSISIRSSIQGKPVTGDLYALAIQSSKINLGILSEKVEGASSGDHITSRTFHIPAASGFMVHERNEESVLYFEEGREAVFFSDETELAEIIRFYLQNDTQRNNIRLAGHMRANADHSLDARAELILQHIKNL